MTDTLDRHTAEERFRAVFSHLGAVAAYARRRGNRDADAVAAEVMTIAWRRLTDVPVDDLRPWLYATARNLVLADARRSSLVATGAAGERVDAVPAPEILELDPALGEALQALSRLDREALLLVAWEDLTPGSGGAFPRHQPDGVPRAAPAGATAPAGEAGRGSERRQLRPECQSRGGDPMSNRSIMFRLRRANPLPEAPAEDAADLFARITALPADPRLEGSRRRAPSRRRRALVLAFTTLVLVALLASTAVAVSRWIGGDVVEPPVTRQEDLDAQTQLTLPPGFEWPEPLPLEWDSVTTRGAGGGRAVLIAMNAWECYWVEAIRSGDQAAGQHAREELNALLAQNVVEAPLGAPEGWTPTPPPTVPFAVFAHDGGLDRTRTTYEQAAAGDPGNLIDSCRANAQR